MLIESILRKQAEISAYKKPSRQCTFHQELLYINDALKETPKLTTKDWYAWNPRLESILMRLARFAYSMQMHKLASDKDELGQG